jgi:hypothetical protein
MILFAYCSTCYLFYGSKLDVFRQLPRIHTPTYDILTYIRRSLGFVCRPAVHVGYRDRNLSIDNTCICTLYTIQHHTVSPPRIKIRISLVQNQQSAPTHR